MMHLTEREIAAEIAVREVSPLNRQDLNDLANLYIVQDRMIGRHPPEVEPAVSTFSAPVQQDADVAGDYGSSDFLRAVSGRNLRDLFEIMDDLMDTLRVVNQRSYDGIMRRIRSL